LQVTTEPLEATFILAHGTEALGLGDCVEAIPLPLDDIKALLAKCAEAEGGAPPMVVANPDFVTVEGTKLRTMPGTLARWYESMGGQVGHEYFAMQDATWPSCLSDRLCQEQHPGIVNSIQQRLLCI
jgi:hypothetical protein